MLAGGPPHGFVFAAALAGLLTTASIATAETHFPVTERDSLLSRPIGIDLGGRGSRPLRDGQAFTFPAANLSATDHESFLAGKRVFNADWFPPGADAGEFAGLGPVFNQQSCSACHPENGRGQPPESEGAPMLSMLVRLSVPGTSAMGGPPGHPAYGDQLNDRAIAGVPAEGRTVVSYAEIPGAFDDGEPYSLRRPTTRFEDLAFGPLGDDILISPRVAPAMIGLGLLEAVPESLILALADPEDSDGDGISGRPNQVWDEAAGTEALGRFGWKANAPNLRQQNAGAAVGDIGITSPMFPDDNCPPGQDLCANAAIHVGPELSASFLDRMTLYTQVLAVPDRRDALDPAVNRGEALFRASGCAECHMPTLLTGDHPVAALSGQTIHPFTDLLLHDMGGGLADGRPDFLANGREWRTPPLWGIGLVGTVNGHSNFLHDGRARNLSEAILWHGGEADAARLAFLAMPKADRDALLAFLSSL